MSDVSIIVTGNVPMKPIGCDLTYGYNMIPELKIDLDPTDEKNIAILCDVNSFRRKTVNVKIQSVKGCINFDGLFDGLSISQSVGSFTYQAVIKSKYQILVESYPVFPGLNPLSSRVFRRDSTTNFDELHGGEKFLTSYQDLSVADDNIIKFFLKCMRALVQRQTELAVISKDVNLTMPLIELINAPKYQENIKKAIELLAESNVDISAVKDLQFLGGSEMQYQTVQTVFTGEASTLWEWFLRGLELFNCVAVIANDKIFVLPQNQFISMPHNKPEYKSTATKNNTALPSQFNSFSFSDTGYKDIGAACLTSDFNFAADADKSPARAQFGIYQDPEATSSGIYVGEAPSLLSLCIRGQVQQTVKAPVEGKPYIENVRDPDSPLNDLAASYGILGVISKKNDAFYNKLAQMEYLRVKYTDRTGGLNLEFTPNWAPGASGTLYTRYPGLFVDFYVNSVTHNIQVGPGSGTAITSVSFSSGRVGTNPIGIDEDILFKYTQADMIEQQGKFIKNISQ